MIFSLKFSPTKLLVKCEGRIMPFYIIMQKSKNLAPMASSEDADGRCDLKNKKEDRRSRKQDINSRQRRTSISLDHCKTTTQQLESSELRLEQ